MYAPVNVLLAAGITAATTAGLTAYACYSKSDFTSYYQGASGNLILYLSGGLVPFLRIFLPHYDKFRNINSVPRQCDSIWIRDHVLHLYCY